MPKGDHQRVENRIDEQMKQGQSYMTGLQGQLQGQYGGLSNNYGGSTPSPLQNTFGFGSTVPHYSWTNSPYYSGNGTDTPSIGGNTAVPRGIPGGETSERYVGSGQSQGARDYEQAFNQMFPGNSLSSDQLWANKDQLAQQGIEVLTNAKGINGKIKLPDGRIIDVIGGADSGLNRRQWYDTSGGSSSLASMFSSGGGGSFGQGGAVGRNLADYNNIMGRYSQFADNGGFSEGDKANIRSRAVSPIRSIYSRGRQELDRNRSLQGGYSPGFATALGRFNREQGQLTSDAATNAEAAIAEMTQRGKLAGMGGMASMYGATPGLSNMFGQQMLQGMGQQIQMAGLQNQFSEGMLRAQLGLSNVPGNYQSALQNISGTIGLGGQAAGIIYPWLGGGSGAGAATGQYGAVPNYQQYL